jgi:hypothetical protein
LNNIIIELVFKDKGKMKLRYKIPLLSVILILILVSVPGCSFFNKSISSSKQITTENPEKNIKPIQDITPFTIVFPEYLPSDMKQYRPTLSISDRANEPESKEIHIWYQYYVNDDLREVAISEDNSFVRWNMDLSENSSYLDFTGTTVLEEKTIEIYYVGYKQYQKDCNRYFWIQNGVNFGVHVVGYSREESRKIVESMIK